MSALDPRIEEIRITYGLEKADFWQIPQNRQWVVKHAALEIVAAKANVEWSSPQIVQADTASGIAVMVVSGRMGTRIEWSTGEASPKNNKNAYPWAMAEKRAKDRVVLKLVGIHGLVYSEDEADDFREKAEPPAKSSAQLKRDGEWERVARDIANAMNDVFTFGQFEQMKASYRQEAKAKGWNATFLDQLAELFEGYAKGLQARIDAENAEAA